MRRRKRVRKRTAPPPPPLCIVNFIPEYNWKARTAERDEAHGGAVSCDLGSRVPVNLDSNGVRIETKLAAFVANAGTSKRILCVPDR